MYGENEMIEQYLEFFIAMSEKDFKKTVTKDEIVEMLTKIKAVTKEKNHRLNVQIKKAS